MRIEAVNLNSQGGKPYLTTCNVITGYCLCQSVYTVAHTYIHLSGISPSSFSSFLSPFLLPPLSLLPFPSPFFLSPPPPLSFLPFSLPSSPPLLSPPPPLFFPSPPFSPSLSLPPFLLPSFQPLLHQHCTINNQCGYKRHNCLSRTQHPTSHRDS